MRIVYGAVLTLVALAAGGVAIVYSGAYNVAASDEHTALGKWVMHTTMHNSVKASADDITAPDLNDSSLIKQGASAYDSLCAACHLKPGLEDTVLRAGLNPMPPNLSEQGHWGAEEQFWIIKHGIKMTGMPAWGVTHKDQELWEMVAFLQRLPGLSEQEYRDLVQPAESSTSGQADDGHDHEHGDMNAMMGSSSDTASESHGEDDGHDHEHGNMSGMMGTPTKTNDHDDGHAQDHGDMSGMEGSTAPDIQDKASDNMSSASAKEEAEPDDHYADGHSH